MSVSCQKHFSKLLDLASVELTSLLQFTTQLKAEKKNGTEVAEFTDRNIALIFERDSTHTRCSFEVAAYGQGVRMTYLKPSGNRIGHRGSVKDTTRVLGRMYGDIQYRGHGQEIIETLAEYAGVPVWDRLTDKFHPTQLLADLLTMQKHLPGKAFNEMTLVYTGDVRNNMGNLMPEAAALIRLDLRLVAPQACQPEESLVARYKALIQRGGGNITLTGDVATGVEGADFIYTDAWIPMGEAKEKWAERIALLRKYQANSAIMALTGNPQTKFLRYLPAFHDNQTTLGKQMAQECGPHGSMEVADEVPEPPASTIFDQAENRMHATKAVMVVILAR